MSDELADLLEQVETPAMQIDPYAVVLGGRRRHHSRVLGRVSGGVAGAAVIAVVAVALSAGRPTTLPSVPGTSGPRTSTAADTTIRPDGAEPGSFAIDVPGVGDGTVNAGGHFWVSPVLDGGQPGAAFQRYDVRGWSASLEAFSVPQGASGAVRQGDSGGSDVVFVLTHGKPSDLAPQRRAASGGTDRWAVGSKPLGSGDLWASILVLTSGTSVQPSEVVSVTWTDTSGPSQHADASPTSVKPRPHPPLGGAAGTTTTTTVQGMDGAGIGPATFRITATGAGPDAANFTIRHIDDHGADLGTEAVALDAGAPGTFVLSGEKVGEVPSFRYIYGLVRGEPTGLALTGDQPARLADGWAVASWPISGRDVTLLVITVPGIDAPGQVTAVTWTAGGAAQAAHVVTPGG